jgi:hypothetical protein
MFVRHGHLQSLQALTCDRLTRSRRSDGARGRTVHWDLSGVPPRLNAGGGLLGNSPKGIVSILALGEEASASGQGAGFRLPRVASNCHELPRVALSRVAFVPAGRSNRSDQAPC